MSKKKFLVGLSSAVAIVAAGAITTHASNVYEEQTGKKLQIDNPVLSELLMENNQNSNDAIQFGQHSSHASHSSHTSHGSHQSHSSHSSGY